MTTVLSSNGIAMVRMFALRGALKLEVLGMHRRGQSVYSIIKSEFGLKGNKQRVLEQFEKLIEEAKGDSSPKGT